MEKTFSEPLALQCLNTLFHGINVFHWVWTTPIKMLNAIIQQLLKQGKRIKTF